jgi:hypothetical protein
MQAAAPLMIAGSLVQGVAGFRSGQANAAAAKQNARQAELEGVAQEQEVRRAARMAMGQQVGAQAESGFQIGTGTALDSLRESAVNAEMDILNVRRKAQSAAAQQRQQAKAAKMEGVSALVGGLTGAAAAAAGMKADYAQQAGRYGTGRSGRIKVVVPDSGPGFSRK